MYRKALAMLTRTRQLKHHMMTMTLATEIPTYLFESKLLMSSGGLLPT